MGKKCTNCRYCLLKDYGYSNYTVEGTDNICLKGLRDEFDNWYGEEKRNSEFAEKCNEYVTGELVYMDCDMEGQHSAKSLGDSYSNDSEIAALINDYFC